MSLDADLNGCAALVQRGDPDRFLATMAAPVAARRVLFPLYAFNLEVARAPWLTQEPMIAEMRLQWWRDALEEIAAGGAVRRHEVVTPLAGVLSPQDARALDGLVEARRWDIYKDPFESDADLDAHIDATAGTLLWTAARLLGPADEAVVRRAARAAGVAGWLRAIPEFEARGRIPLVDGTAAGIRRLAGSALADLRQARAQRARVSKDAAPALLSVWQAGPVLRRALADPRRVADGALAQSEARRRATLMLRAATGRW